MLQSKYGICLYIAYALPTETKLLLFLEVAAVRRHSDGISNSFSRNAKSPLSEIMAICLPV